MTRPRVLFLETAKWFFLYQSRETRDAIGRAIERAVRSRNPRGVKHVRGTARLHRLVVADCRVLYLRSERRLVVVSVGNRPTPRAMEMVFSRFRRRAEDEEGPVDAEHI